MVVARRIGTYKVLLLDGQVETDSGHAGFVYFYAPSGDYLGYVCGIKTAKRLPNAVQLENRIVQIYVPETELLDLIDLLQVERDVYIRFDAVRSEVTVEPVGARPSIPLAHIVETTGSPRDDALQEHLND